MSHARMTTMLIFIFLLCPLVHILLHFLFMERNFTIVQSILTILGKITEMVNIECHMQE